MMYDILDIIMLNEKQNLAKSLNLPDSYDLINTMIIKIKIMCWYIKVKIILKN